MKTYYIQREFLNLGKTMENFSGISLPVYDRERTLCDCFKYRTKLDNELFNKAVNAYAADEKKESCQSFQICENNASLHKSNECNGGAVEWLM